MKVKDLKDYIMNQPKGLTPFLYCDHCGQESSAYAGDYFMLGADHEFMCCDLPMRLVIKQIEYKDV